MIRMHSTLSLKSVLRSAANRTYVVEKVLSERPEAPQRNIHLARQVAAGQAQ